MLTVKEFRNKYDIALTLNHSGKMEGLTSLSTSTLCNENCRKRISNPNMICSKCYAETLSKMRKSLRENLIKNSEVLSTTILEEFPYLFSETGLFRFESFGDLINEIQVVNYFNMALNNPHMACALWTKNPWIIKRTIEQYDLKKPENLRIIGSSYYLNKDMVDYYKQYDFIDNVFTVYTKPFIKENNIEITCGGNSCRTCQKCYRGTHTSFNITEQLK